MKYINLRTKTSLTLTLILGFIANSNTYAADDIDRDGIANLIDNCIETNNPRQTDSDGDGFGNQCDPDLNNDSKVNSEDLKLFNIAQENAQSGREFNESADFNVDGKINREDFAILDHFMQKRLAPGPTALKFDARFTDAPPRVKEMSLFEVSGDSNGNDGNAAVMLRFDEEDKIGATITIKPNLRPVALNDLGLGADIKEGDGIFSGFVDIDFKERNRAVENFTARLNRKKDRTVSFFSGRSLIDSVQFDEQKNPGFAITRSFKLNDGRVLRPVQPALDTVALASSTAPAQTLGINNLSVVKDSTRTFNPCLDENFSANTAADGNVNGAWSFKTLMANMANPGLTGVSPQTFIHEWLQLWMSNQNVNDFTIGARTNIQNFFPGWDGVNATTLDINRLPFRLLAIMNRIDLGTTSLYGGASPGETRFIFALVDPTSCTARPMTVILEYQDVTPNCPDVKARANDWVALDGLPFPSAAYNNALQNITDTVTLANAAPSKANGSAIGQIRTNDFAFSTPWQLREFGLLSGGPLLAADTIKQTPHEPQYNSSGVDNALLAEYMENEARAILCESHSVPEIYGFTGGAQNFLTGHVNYNLGDFWNAPINPANLPTSYPSCYQTTLTSPPSLADIPSEVLHKLSLNTCDDCHSGETLTSFVHINWSSNAAFTIPASFSDFVTGAGGVGHFVSDPRGSGLTREFDEFTRRGQILDDLATRQCGISFDSLDVRNAGFNFVH